MGGGCPVSNDGAQTPLCLLVSTDLFSPLWAEMVCVSFEPRFFLRGKCLCMLSSHFWIKTPYWAPRHGKVDRWNDLDSESITWRSATLDCCEEEVNDFYVWAFLYLGIYLLLQLRLSWLNNGSGLTQHSSKNGLEKSEIS